jgi:hypothetical protein
MCLHSRSCIYEGNTHPWWGGSHESLGHEADWQERGAWWVAEVAPALSAIFEVVGASSRASGKGCGAVECIKDSHTQTQRCMVTFGGKGVV